MKKIITTTCILLSLMLIVSSQVIAQVTVAESFEIITPQTTWPNFYLPFGWTQHRITYASDTANLWKRIDMSATSPTCTPHTGFVMMRYTSDESQVVGSQSALVSKPYDFRAYNSSGAATVKFWMYRDTGAVSFNDNISVYINNLPNLTGAALLSGSTNPINRPCSSNPVVSCANSAWYQYSYNIPFSAGLTNTATTYIIFVAASSAGNNMYIDDFTIDTWPQQQTYSTSYLFHQEKYDVNKNSQNNLVIGINVKMIGSGTPYTFDSINFNTNGTTTNADILNAKLYWTGGTSIFTPLNAVLLGNIAIPSFSNYRYIFPSVNTIITSGFQGSNFITVSSALGVTIGCVVTAAGITPMTTVTAINGNILTLSKPLSATIMNTACLIKFYFDNGDNYLWVTYDVVSSATVGNYIDAEFLSIGIGGTVNTPTIISSPGGRHINYGYCGGVTPLYITGTSWLNNSYTNNDYVRSVLLPGYAAVFPPGITNIYNTVWSPQIPASSCTYPTCRFSCHPPDHEKFSPLVTGNTATLLRDSVYIINAQAGTWGSGNYIAAWIDFDNDGVFNNTSWSLGGEKILQTGSLVALSWTGAVTFKVPANAAIGTTTLRVREVYLGTNIDPCAPAMYGETEDYEITIASPVAVSEFLAQDFNLKINPNPNDGNVKVHYKLPLNETGNFDVVDFLGKTIFSMPLPLGSSMQNINLEKLPAGVYSVRISCNKSYANARLIKQ